jgi:hypothetical protein
MRGARWAALFAVVATSTASCGDDGRGPDADVLVSTAVEDGPMAVALLEQLRSEFAIVDHPLPIDAAMAPVPDATPVLPPTDVVGFDREGDALVPRLGSAGGRPAVSLRIAESAADGFRLSDTASSMTLNVRLEEAHEAKAEAAGGFLVYPEALGERTEVIHRTSSQGIEDFVRFEQRPATEALRYQVELGEGVAGVRVIADMVEFLDAGGTPRLRVAPPYVIDALGRVELAHLDVDGCAVDRDPRAPWGRSPVEPGAETCTVTVTWGGEHLAYPLLVDPSWSGANTMAAARYWHIASVLPSGKVLVAGGVGTGGTILNSAEIWNPGTNTWGGTGPMANTRYAHAAVKTATGPYVVVAGGSGNCTGGPTCNQAERYSESAGTWSSAGTMSARRTILAMAVLTTTPETVIAVGGLNNSGIALNTADIYDPAGNSWAATSGGMNNARYGHTATALSASASSVVLVAGGESGSGLVVAAEKYNPSTDTFSGAGNMLAARRSHTASNLPSDYVLAAGGIITATACTKRAEKYNYATNTWSAVASQLYYHCYHAAATLDNAKVLITGGQISVGGASSKTAELYDSVGNTWTNQPDMATTRHSHTATTYPSSPVSKVLVAGGYDGTTVRNQAEYYTP